MKRRLDAELVERYPEYTRNQLQSWIMQGLVFVNGVRVDKPGTPVALDAVITVSHVEQKYVGRAGFKLAGALDHFKLDVTGYTVLDATSTGGFTDCLLQRGAVRVYGVDVGYGQVHEKIRQDPRVVVMERTNLRHLTSLPAAASLPDAAEQVLVDLVTLDLSFISLLKVIDAVVPLMRPGGSLITLIKPQFEAGRADVERGGIVKDPAVHTRVIAEVVAGITATGFTHVGTIESPITGMMGNKEFLALFRKKETV